ncbi:hypothetical protein V6N13_126565 [Hibiscus sabdariffa]|uniref:Uncharacterized protein n=1 Tax=Hibiscus sabdariffa TaxID=183260 RepID=A0ABR2RF63_9ROSI
MHGRIRSSLHRLQRCRTRPPQGGEVIPAAATQQQAAGWAVALDFECLNVHVHGGNLQPLHAWQAQTKLQRCRTRPSQGGEVVPAASAQQQATCWAVALSRFGGQGHLKVARWSPQHAPAPQVHGSTAEVAPQTDQASSRWRAPPRTVVFGLFPNFFPFVLSGHVISASMLGLLDFSIVNYWVCEEWLAMY